MERACGFFRDVLRLSEGQFEGRPFNLHPSQVFIVGSLFGWKRADGTRRFHRAYIEQGKGNGKSPLAAGIGLYGLLADGEAGAEIYAAAAKKEQAQVLFRDAVKMRNQSPRLLENVQASGGPGREFNLAYLKNGSFFRPISRDAGKSGSGPRPHMALCDEVHEHPDRNIMEMLERGFKFRRQPLLLMITNSGTDRNSICWEEHEHAVKVAHGEMEDDTTFSYVCGLDDGDDPLNDPSCWVKANPLLGGIITDQYLAGVVAQAKAIPGKLNNILRLHFCVWTDAENAWISQEAFMACEDPVMRLEHFEGQEVWCGLDLSATKDMTAVAYVFRDGDDAEGRPRFALFVRGYTPAETLSERALHDKAPYEVWARPNEYGVTFLNATPGKVVRYDYVAADLLDMSARHPVKAVAYDRFLIKHFEEALDEMGATLPIVEHPQGTSHRKGSDLFMPDSVNALEDLILERRIRIEVNPALRSAVMGACFWTSPAGLRRFEKQRATRRIDLAVAAAMAVGAATTTQPAAPKYQMIFV
jgi:phage terminase large subunit-like protein